jgi:hypothetical protein
LQYLSYASLSRITPPKCIKDILAFKETVLRGKVSGFGVVFAYTEDLIDTPPPKADSIAVPCSEKRC